jgi:thiamine pyrophosphokinase
MSHALIFANGDVSDGVMVKSALNMAHHPHVIAADGGARVAAYYGWRVQAVVGDFDSLTAPEQASLRASGAEFVTFPPEKDFTDLELALKFAREHGADWIRIIGGLGNRLDQTIGNVYLLALPELAGCDVQLVAGNQAVWLAPSGTHLLQGDVGDTLSLIPVGGAVHGIRTEGLYYPLNDETLNFGPARGISNVFTQSEATFHTTEGTLLVIHTKGRA